MKHRRIVLWTVTALALLAAEPARAHCADGQWAGWRRSLTWNEQGADLASALAYGAAAGGIFWGASPADERFAGNAFDESLLDALSPASSRERRRAANASDVFLATTGLAPLLTVGLAAMRDGDCDRALRMSVEIAEAFAASSLVLVGAKTWVARARPSCVGVCRNDELRSFFSGHTSMAALGAGLICRHTVRQDLFYRQLPEGADPTRLQRARNGLTCGAAALGATLTGVLRVTAHKHWPTDILAGWVVGGVIGYYGVPPGPGDWVRRILGRTRGDPPTSALLLPTIGSGAIGARALVSF